MFWYDTASNWLYARNETNSAWIRFAFLDQATNRISLVDDTSIVNTSGAQVGFLGDQSTGTWQAGTGTTQSLVSPANVKAAILALTSTYTQPTATGAVGTYATAGRYLTGAHSFIAGSSYAGSGLKYGGAAVGADTTNNGANQVGYPQTSSTTMSGTWRAMGGAYRPSSGTTVTTFLRIA